MDDRRGMCLRSPDVYEGQSPSTQKSGRPTQEPDRFKSSQEAWKEHQNPCAFMPGSLSPAQQRALLARLEAARQLYNACLGEAKRRVGLVRQSKVYRRARSLSKEEPSRKALFAQARAQYQFSEYALHAYSNTLQQSWLGAHLDANTTQKLATMAYRAANQLLLGKARRVRFKGPNQLDSVEGKTNASGIRWCGDRIEWSGLVLPALIDPRDVVLAHGLACRVKYVRLVRRKLGERQRFYAQLVVEGVPHPKEPHELGNGVVGLDLGPQTIAIVGEQRASLQMFCPDVVPDARTLRRLDRKIERQRRSNNPHHYDDKGRVKRGKKRWQVSQRQRRVLSARRERHRKLAATRKRCHGQLAHRVFALGSAFHLEHLSYRAWQKRYGKSVGLCAPGLFVAHLTRLAASAGGRVIDINPGRARLSQSCHCGAIARKRLSQRHHHCSCGVSAQRDLYSAFLARCVDPDNSLLDAGRARLAWPGTEPFLQAAFEQAIAPNQSTSGRRLPASFGVPQAQQSQSGSPAQRLLAKAKGRDAVPRRKRPGRARQRRR